MPLLAATSGFTGNTALVVLFALVFSFFGYRLSLRHHAQRGVTPWRFPSIVWALICLASGPIGILVEFFAGATTRAEAVAEHAVELPTVADISRENSPAETTPAETNAHVPLIATLQPPKGADGSAPAPFGWYPDVLGRHEYRYFDGKFWGEQVADGGVVSRDPLE